MFGEVFEENASDSEAEQAREGPTTGSDRAQDVASEKESDEVNPPIKRRKLVKVVNIDSGDEPDEEQDEEPDEEIES